MMDGVGGVEVIGGMGADGVGCGEDGVGGVEVIGGTGADRVGCGEDEDDVEADVYGVGCEDVSAVVAEAVGTAEVVGDARALLARGKRSL